MYTIWAPIRSSLIHFACIGVAPPSRGGETPMQAKWIKLDLGANLGLSIPEEAFELTVYVRLHHKRMGLGICIVLYPNKDSADQFH